MTTRASEVQLPVDNPDLALELVNAALSDGLPASEEPGAKQLSMSDRARVRADAPLIAQLYAAFVARLDRFSKK
jgi:hypothetical protein